MSPKFRFSSSCREFIDYNICIEEEILPSNNLSPAHNQQISYKDYFSSNNLIIDETKNVKMEKVQIIEKKFEIFQHLNSKNSESKKKVLEYFERKNLSFKNETLCWLLREYFLCDKNFLIFESAIQLMKKIFFRIFETKKSGNHLLDKAKSKIESSANYLGYKKRKIESNLKILKKYNLCELVILRFGDINEKIANCSKEFILFLIRSKFINFYLTPICNNLLNISTNNVCNESNMIYKKLEVLMVLLKLKLIDEKFEAILKICSNLIFLILKKKLVDRKLYKKILEICLFVNKKNSPLFNIYFKKKPINKDF
jgi:hypothetical protein